MPHIIVEHTQGLEETVSDLLPRLHQALGAQQDVDPARIKARSLAYDTTLVGADATPGAMVHVTAKILSGRSLALRQTYAEALITVVRKATWPDGIKITQEVVEMERESYQFG